MQRCCTLCVMKMTTVAATTMVMIIMMMTMMVPQQAFLPHVLGNEGVDWMGGSTHCGVAQQQGRRSHQEDRVICMPELLLPGPGGCSDHGLHVGLFGVFDGHNGAEASEFASTHLPHLLCHHTWSIVSLESNEGPDADSSCVGGEPNDMPIFSFYEGVQGRSSITDERRIDDKCKHMQFSVPLYRAILKEALSRALADIDSALINKSGKRGLQSGSTALVVLKVENHLLVANIGDSKAFLCSSFTEADADPPRRNASISIAVKELTVDHHPDRVDERSRIEAAGGFVTTWGGVARVNGQLAISRAIGDATFKKYGVIAEPEFFEWHEFTSADAFLIITSDGVFERMVPQDVCNLVQDKYRGFSNLSLLYNKSAGATLDYEALADTIVKAAYRSGSYDNLAAVLYPLNSSRAVASISKPTETSRICHSSERDVADMLASHESSSCYELIEKVPSGVVLPLETSAGLVFSVSTGMVMARKTEIKGSLEYRYGCSIGSLRKLEAYHEHLICLRRPVLSDEDEVCLNPETFSAYLRLIEAVPVPDRSFSNISDKVNSMDTNAFYPYTSIHKRYVLTKNIGRGGFGEVWFAVSKKRSNAENTDTALDVKNVFDVPDKSHDLKSEDLVHMLTKSLMVSTKTSPDLLQDLFVLKRILVEKGNEVYLSGVREKHFGELFLNARKLRNLRTTRMHEKKKSFQEEDDGLRHIARYVESFDGNVEGNLWLVFINEGYPLSSMIYTADTTIEKDQGHVRVLESSNWWKWLRTTKDGLREMRSLLHQLLLGVKACHDRNITHRDIKPENMMVRARSRCLVSAEGSQLHEEFPCKSMRMIDFGSAVDAYSLHNLYGPLGPSRSEQTEEYTPPESFLQRNWSKVYGKDSTKYDLWSIGVVMLELVLGTPHVFQIAARTRALLDQHLEGWGSSALNTAYMEEWTSSSCC